MNGDLFEQISITRAEVIGLMTSTFFTGAAIGIAIGVAVVVIARWV